MSNVFDKLAVSRPINKAAASVMSSGESYNFVQKDADVHHLWKTPPKMIAPATHTGQEDLRGKRFGRFTVLGVLDVPAGAGGRPWVVKCVCGNYTTRRRKAMFNPTNQDDCCNECRNTKNLREKSLKVSVRYENADKIREKHRNSIPLNGGPR
jgi:hypothetical protein